RRHQALRERLGVARRRRWQARSREHRQPGQPADGRQEADRRDRRVGARLLPEVPEPPPRLSRRVVERDQLGRGERAVQEIGFGLWALGFELWALGRAALRRRPFLLATVRYT